MSRTPPGRMLISRLGDGGALVSAACDFILGARPTSRNEGTLPAWTNRSAGPLFLPGPRGDSSLRWKTFGVR